MTESKPLRIGYVPEHFSTPLHYASTKFSLSSTLIPFPSGTGHMITSLRSGEIDIGIGLTEGWVAGLGKESPSTSSLDYRIIGTYVETPLCWAISTGPNRDINEAKDLKNGKIGVSRIGSGSYVMGFVLADQNGWLVEGERPFEVVPLQTFEKLREGVREGTADFFMWEHFTSKRYYDNNEIKRIGEIYTPWPSWQIVASTSISPTDSRLTNLFSKLDQGIKHFNSNPEENINYISTSLDYSKEDAREWLKTVKFAEGTKGVDVKVVEKTLGILRKAGVVGEEGMKEDEMAAIKRT